MDGLQEHIHTHPIKRTDRQTKTQTDGHSPPPTAECIWRGGTTSAASANSTAWPASTFVTLVLWVKVTYTLKHKVTWRSWEEWGKTKSPEGQGHSRGIQYTKVVSRSWELFGTPRLSQGHENNSWCYKIHSMWYMVILSTPPWRMMTIVIMIEKVHLILWRKKQLLRTHLCPWTTRKRRRRFGVRLTVKGGGKEKLVYAKGRLHLLFSLTRSHARHTVIFKILMSSHAECMHS